MPRQRLQQQGRAHHDHPQNGSYGGGGRNKSSSNATALFHPKLIFAQIVSLQCFHYLFLALLFQINHVVFNREITLDRIFTDKYIHVLKNIQHDWPDIFAILSSYLFGYDIDNMRRDDC